MCSSGCTTALLCSTGTADHFEACLLDVLGPFFRLLLHHEAKWPAFPHVEHARPLAGHPVGGCDQAPQFRQSRSGINSVATKMSIRASDPPYRSRSGPVTVAVTLGVDGCAVPGPAVTGASSRDGCAIWVRANLRRESLESCLLFRRRRSFQR